MANYKYTQYFENEVLRKRPYLKKEWCVKVLENPVRTEPQEWNRYRFWGRIEELGGKILRVVTLEDRFPYTMLSLTEDSKNEDQLLS